MATFIIDKQHEVRVPHDSPAIARLRAGGATDVRAFTLCYRHPRYRNRRSPPSYHCQFRSDGVRYHESGDSPAELDAALAAHADPVGSPATGSR